MSTTSIVRGLFTSSDARVVASLASRLARTPRSSDVTTCTRRQPSPTPLILPCRSPGGYAAVVAQKLNALMFTLEHRFYGESMPAPLTDRETLSTLAIDTVMEDLAAFITYINQQIGNDNGQHQWVVIGGSYAGALSAWFREKHPELAAVSWSSSGVVNAIFNFTAFDQQIVEDVDTECYNALRAVTSAFEDAWAAGGRTKQNMLDLFGTPSYFTQVG